MAEPNIYDDNGVLQTCFVCGGPWHDHWKGHERCEESVKEGLRKVYLGVLERG